MKEVKGFSVWGVGDRSEKVVEVFRVEGSGDVCRFEELWNDCNVDWIEKSVDELKKIGIEVGVWKEKEDGDVEEIDDMKWEEFWDKVC